jgi:hypothetical protein
VAPSSKFEPLMLISTVLPGSPLLGSTPVTVGVTLVSGRVAAFDEPPPGNALIT